MCFDKPWKIFAALPSAEKYMRIVLAMEAREGRQSRASHGDDWPPLRGDDGHLSSTWYSWQGGWQIINTQWAFRQLWTKCGVELHQRDLSSGLMTVGDSNKIWHPQFFAAFTFRVPTFDQDSATADPSYDLRHSVKPRGSLGSHLAYSTSDGIAEEVEAMLREAFGSLSSSPPAEKHVRIGLATEAREGPYCIE